MLRISIISAKSQQEIINFYRIKYFQFPISELGLINKLDLNYLVMK